MSHSVINRNTLFSMKLLFLICLLLFLPQLGFSKHSTVLRLDGQSIVQEKQKNIKTSQIELRGPGPFPVDIPDNSAAGVNIEIEASSFIGTIESLTFELEISHSWVGDLSATLIAPNGISQMVLFSRVGRTPDSNNGFSSILSGTYAFNDQSTQDMWQVASMNKTIPIGEYRTSTSGTDLSHFGGCTTRLNGAFKGLTARQANGTWILNISDNAVGDTGQVLSVGLLADEDTSDLDAVFKSGFEVEYANFEVLSLPASNVLGNCKKAQFDFSGNGLSDYNLYYGSEDGDLVSFITPNIGAATEDDFEVDILTPLSLNPVMTSGGDFDGDGITDIVIRADSISNEYDYLVRRSSRPDDLWVSISTTLDFNDPQFGDYDGDGLDDLAFFIANESMDVASIFFIFDSSTSMVRQYSLDSGMRSDFRAAGGFDHTGNGIADLLLLVNDGSSGNEQALKIYDGSNGSLILTSLFTFFSQTKHFPGVFLDAETNNGRAGVALFADNLPDPDSGAYGFNVFDDIDLSIVGGSIIFGMDPTDTPITGDYDGDGIDDIGVWRPNTDGMGNRFIIRPSGIDDPDNNLIVIRPKNATKGDVPLGNARVR